MAEVAVQRLKPPNRQPPLDPVVRATKEERRYLVVCCPPGLLSIRMAAILFRAL
jgi:hypothetical protein